MPGNRESQLIALSWVVFKTWKPVRRSAKRQRYPQQDFAKMFVFTCQRKALKFMIDRNSRSSAFCYSHPIQARRHP